MEFSADNIQLIINVAKEVMADKFLAYVQSLANWLEGPNDRDCGCPCNVKSLYNYICQAEWRQAEMTDNEDYQVMISKLFNCMSLQPEYYVYTGGVNVINATVSSQGGGTSGGNNISDSFEITPPSDTTVIPVLTSDKHKLIGATSIVVLREGIGMQTKDNTRPDYFSFDNTTGEITITSPASGTEIFTIIYSKENV